MMRVFLAGASGVIGVQIVPRLPPPPRIHVEEAARRTIQLLEQSSGVVVVSEDED